MWAKNLTGAKQKNQVGKVGVVLKKSNMDLGDWKQKSRIIWIKKKTGMVMTIFINIKVHTLCIVCFVE